MTTSRPPITTTAAAFTAALTLLLTALTAAPAAAGPLTPPAGPVAPTGKPLAELEPRRPISAATTPGDADSVYRITAPGSYYLTDRVLGAPGKCGIEISTSNVTIDLNGFDLTGGQGSLSGIATPVAGLSNIEIRNGSIRFWGASGIDLATSATRGCRLGALRCTNNGGAGILAGPACTITDCIAGNNAGDGITTGIIAILIGCKAFANGADGFDAGAGSTLDACAARENQSAGFRVGAGSRIDGCTATLNGYRGFIAAGGSSLSGCVAADNDSDGFAFTGAVTITGCTASDNTRSGFTADPAFNDEGLITSCTATGNGHDGFNTSGSFVFSHCAAIENGRIGFSAGTHSAVTDCLARGNGSHGISTSNGLIRGNVCVENGANSDSGAGIEVFLGGHVEGNHCENNDVGIRARAIGAFIIRNTARGHLISYELDADNYYGPIVNLRFTDTPAVSGHAAAGTVGTTHPWANFAY